MNFIREVKQRADIVKVAEYFGLKNKQCCPFHKEKTASFSISPSKQIWHCFGCGKGGDAISLVSEFLNINALEAAKVINEKLCLGLDIGRPASYLEINKYKQKRKIEEAFKKWENETFQLLCDYLHLLWKWEETQKWDSDLYLEAIQNKDYIDYLIDEIFINGSNQDKIWFWKYKRERVKKIESRIRRYRTTNE